MESSSSTARFELHLGIELSMVEMVRRFIESLYTELLNDEIASRVALTTHELMDNAIKYATSDHFKVSIELDDQMLQVYTQNHASPANIASLVQLMEEMHSHSDPFEFYLQLMARSAHRLDVSGLGLGRIWAEADMTLSCETRANLVSIRARMPVARSEA